MVTREGSVSVFERERSRLLVQQRFVLAISLVVGTIILLASVQASGVTEQGFGDDPMARIAQFLSRLAPNLRVDALFEDRQTSGSLAAWYYDWPTWIAASFETIQIALMATIFGAIGGLGAATLAARNTMRFGVVRFIVRRFLEILRTVPELVLAIILVAAFGVGPFAGVLAVTIGTIGGLGKLFTEVIENADPSQTEAVKASGAGWANQIRYGVLPQIAPNLASYGLLRLEINIAAAAALGIVGAGGIGLELQRAITMVQFQTYLAILLIMVVTIVICDLVSGRIRARLIGLASPQ